MTTLQERLRERYIDIPTLEAAADAIDELVAVLALLADYDELNISEQIDALHSAEYLITKYKAGSE